MKKALVPFNITLLIPTRDQLRMLGQIKSHEIFYGNGGNFHEQGLFSVEIFGRIGSHERESNFGYIKLGLPVFHPLVFKNITKLKALYEEIIMGRQYAVFDPVHKDFVKATELDGKTGFTFFMDNWQKIEFAETRSSIRQIRLSLINKYKANAVLHEMLVIPAAYRDAEIDNDGRVEYDEVNDIYRTLLNQTTGIPDKFGPNDDLSIYDRRRVAMQMKIQEIYEHYENLISGKRGYIQSKWASRRIFNGTRNVISSLDTNAADLDAPNRPRFKDAVIGLYQASRAAVPKVIYGLRNSLIAEIFDSMSNRVQLVNKKTLKREWVDISNEDMDLWGTPEGLDRVVNELEVVEKRSRAIEIAGHYLGLMYLDDKQNFRILRDVDDVPADFDRRFVRPLTYGELIYLSGLSMWYKLSAFITRYPVENYNSSIPVKIYVKTTVVAEIRYPLDHEFKRDPKAAVALEYPIYDVGVPAQWHDSTSISPSVLEPLGADFDGDTISVNVVYSKEAIEESDAFFKTRLAYVQAGGGLAFSVGIHTLSMVLQYMTGEPISRD